MLMDTSLLRVHMLRVLRALCEARGPLTRSKIADKSGLSSTVVSRAIGYEDPDKRAAWEEPTDKNKKSGGGYPSLLTLGLVRFETLDIDGLVEVCYEPTPEGKEAFRATASQVLPPIRQ